MLSNKVFTEWMVRLSNFFQKSDSSDLFYKDCYNAVKHFSDSQFIRAAQHIIKTRTNHFFPLPAELWKAVEETREIVQITPEAKRIEPNYSPCPPEVKKQMEEIMERLKKKGIK